MVLPLVVLRIRVPLLVYDHYGVVVCDGVVHCTGDGVGVVGIVVDVVVSVMDVVGV